MFLNLAQVEYTQFPRVIAKCYSHDFAYYLCGIYMCLWKVQGRGLSKRGQRLRECVQIEKVCKGFFYSFSIVSFQTGLRTTYGGTPQYGAPSLGECSRNRTVSGYQLALL